MVGPGLGQLGSAAKGTCEASSPRGIALLGVVMVYATLKLISWDARVLARHALTDREALAVVNMVSQGTCMKHAVHAHRRDDSGAHQERNWVATQVQLRYGTAPITHHTWREMLSPRCNLRAHAADVHAVA